MTLLMFPMQFLTPNLHSIHTKKALSPLSNNETNHHEYLLQISQIDNQETLGYSPEHFRDCK